MLDVGQGHSLYFELSGNPKGMPVLFLHGGPGAGLPANYRRFFNPEHYWIIGFDQRGCGKSKPFASLEANTTDHLVADIEQIRHYLGISTWLIFGGSWGSTLGLVYAIQHSEAVIGLILRGAFLAREQDTEWFLCPNGGAANVFPEQYQHFAQYAREVRSPQAICDQYYDIFNHSNELQQAKALKAWYSWEERISRLVLPQTSRIDADQFHLVKSLALLECHYLKHQCFIPENYILDNLNVLADIPGTIIHGRYDMICKLEAAHSLHKGWRNSELRIVPDAGHSTLEPGVAKALCQATEQFARFMRKST